MVKKIGFTIGKFAPLHKGHQLLIETALREMDEFYIVIYETDSIEIDLKTRAKWIKKLYPQVHILYAYNSPQKYGLDPESVQIQMKYLCSILKGISVTHFYNSEPYGEKVAEYLKIKNRTIDRERKQIPIRAKTIRQDYLSNKDFLEQHVLQDCVAIKKTSQ